MYTSYYQQIRILQFLSLFLHNHTKRSTQNKLTSYTTTVSPNHEIIGLINKLSRNSQCDLDLSLDRLLFQPAIRIINKLKLTDRTLFFKIITSYHSRIPFHRILESLIPKLDSSIIYDPFEAIYTFTLFDSAESIISLITSYTYWSQLSVKSCGGRFLVLSCGLHGISTSENGAARKERKIIRGSFAINRTTVPPGPEADRARRNSWK